MVASSVIRFPALGLFTDLYELTMAQGYWKTGKAEDTANFDYTFRDLPFNGGYVVFAGVQELLELLQHFRFDADALQYLKDTHFDEEFLEYLSTFSFRGSVYSVREGEVVFPYEPVLRVEGPLLDVQLVETIVINVLSFQSLIATKAARLVQAAQGRPIVDFGLRRAHGWGGVQAARAALIGGVKGTSNVMAGMHYGLPVSGTHAHSWVQSFDNEADSFRQYAELYPDKSVFLIDTYHTLDSGLPNAIRVAKEMEQRGHKLKAVRLDSGDLAALSKVVRKRLDEAGLGYVRIVASNKVDEYAIQKIVSAGAPVDMFGAGTRLVTGGESSWLDGVYKLSAINGHPSMKLTDTPDKSTFPGIKNIVRVTHKDGRFKCDCIVSEEEPLPDSVTFPLFDADTSKAIGQDIRRRLLTPVMSEGQILEPPSSMKEIQDYAAAQLSLLPDVFKRLKDPAQYPVGLSPRLRGLVQETQLHLKGVVV